ncbi:unnamed protein product [Lupinus luteus]|uniref:Uncharacterized protein n=1 Tax=Lupinus luteus TaxID=3873 RepID=A0AAV1YID2_LUPLU
MGGLQATFDETQAYSNILSDKESKPFNLKDLYQIFKIHSHQSGGSFSKSIAPGGIPPTFLRKKDGEFKFRAHTNHAS